MASIHLNTIWKFFSSFFSSISFSWYYQWLELGFARVCRIKKPQCITLFLRLWLKLASEQAKLGREQRVETKRLTQVLLWNTATWHEVTERKNERTNGDDTETLLTFCTQYRVLQKNQLEIFCQKKISLLKPLTKLLLFYAARRCWTYFKVYSSLRVTLPLYFLVALKVNA